MRRDKIGISPAGRGREREETNGNRYDSENGTKLVEKNVIVVP
jgi:hypothetical protein